MFSEKSDYHTVPDKDGEEEPLEYGGVVFVTQCMAFMIALRDVNLVIYAARHSGMIARADRATTPDIRSPLFFWTMSALFLSVTAFTFWVLNKHHLLRRHRDLPPWVPVPVPFGARSMLLGGLAEVLLVGRDLAMVWFPYQLYGTGHYGLAICSCTILMALMVGQMHDHVTSPTSAAVKAWRSVLTTHEFSSQFGDSADEDAPLIPDGPLRPRWLTARSEHII